MSDLPEPLTPPDCNLRGLRWMPIDIVRLLESDLYLLSTGDQFKAAVTLWAKSWNQVPAASLPNNEKLLEGLSLSKHWKKVREVAMRGFILCSDNRWYHPVIAEKALEAMERRDEYEDKQENKESRQKRYRERRAHLFEVLREHGIVPDGKTTMDELQRLASSLGVTESVTDDTHSVTHVTSRETANERTGTRQDSKPKTKGDRAGVGTSLARAEPADLTSAMRRHSIDAQPADPRVIAASRNGVLAETVDAACAEAKSRKPGERISAGYVLAMAESWTREARHERPTANARASPRPSSLHEQRDATIAGLTGRNRYDAEDRDTIDIDAHRVE